MRAADISLLEVRTWTGGVVSSSAGPTALGCRLGLVGAHGEVPAHRRLLFIVRRRPTLDLDLNSWPPGCEVRFSRGGRFGSARVVERDAGGAASRASARRLRLGAAERLRARGRRRCGRRDGLRLPHGRSDLRRHGRLGHHRRRRPRGRRAGCGAGAFGAAACGRACARSWSCSRRAPPRSWPSRPARAAALSGAGGPDERTPRAAVKAAASPIPAIAANVPISTRSRLIESPAMRRLMSSDTPWAPSRRASGTDRCAREASRRGSGSGCTCRSRPTSRPAP